MKIWARWPYIHLSVVFPSRMPAGPHFVTQPILLSENIPNIWHKSSTKNTRRSNSDWNDKNDNANYAPSLSHGRFYQWLRLPFLKKYSIMRKDLDCELFYSGSKRHNVSLYLLSSHGGIYIVLENDNNVLIKGLKKVAIKKFLRNTYLIETSYDRLTKRNHISAIQGKSCQAGVGWL